MSLKQKKELKLIYVLKMKQKIMIQHNLTMMLKKILARLTKDIAKLEEKYGVKFK